MDCASLCFLSQDAIVFQTVEMGLMMWAPASQEDAHMLAERHGMLHACAMIGTYGPYVAR